MHSTFNIASTLFFLLLSLSSISFLHLDPLTPLNQRKEIEKCAMCVHYEWSCFVFISHQISHKSVSQSSRLHCRERAISYPFAIVYQVRFRLNKQNLLSNLLQHRNFTFHIFSFFPRSPPRSPQRKKLDFLCLSSWVFKINKRMNEPQWKI